MDSRILVSPTQYTERIPIIQVSETVTEMAVSGIPITEASEMQTQMVVSEIVMVVSEMGIQAVSETATQVASEIHNPMEDSVIRHHKQDLTIIISNHSRDIITAMEASDLMIQEASDPAEASMAAEAASEVVPAAEAE